MNGIILSLIFILICIEYWFKQYRIKRSQKKISYRSSNSYYDDTDYSKYKPYKEVYTIKICIVILIIALIINIILESIGI